MKKIMNVVKEVIKMNSQLGRYDVVNPFDFGLQVDDVLLLFEIRGVF